MQTYYRHNTCTMPTMSCRVPYIHRQRKRLGRPARRWGTTVSDAGTMQAYMMRPVRAGRTAHDALKSLGRPSHPPTAQATGEDVTALGYNGK